MQNYVDKNIKQENIGSQWKKFQDLINVGDKLTIIRGSIQGTVGINSLISTNPGIPKSTSA